METNQTSNKHHLFNILLGVIVVLIVVFASKYFYNRLTYLYTDDASVQQNMVPVNARVGGYLNRVNFEEFSYVNQGDTLVVIDPTDYKLRIEQAQAGLEDVLSRKEVLESNVTTLQNAQLISKANLKASEARLWNAKQNYERFEQLVEEGSATQQQFDQIKSEYESLQAGHEAATKATRGAELSTLESKKRLQAIEAAIKMAQSRLDIAKQDLDYTVILAPCSGFIGRKDIHQGQLVGQGQSLVQIVDDSQKWVTANFLEKQTKDIEVGTAVNISIDAFPDQEFKGRIESISAATGSAFALVPTDNSTGNFVKVQQRIPVRISLKGISSDWLKKIRAGMNVEVFVEQE